MCFPAIRRVSLQRDSQYVTVKLWKFRTINEISDPDKILKRILYMDAA